MGKCEKCGKEIEDNYKFCYSCSAELKNKTETKKDLVVNQLQKNNNNLYKLTKQLDVILRENHKISVVWSRDKHDFIEVK